MNWRRFFFCLLIVWLFLEFSGYIIHMVFLRSEYLSESLKAILRSPAQLKANMWLIWISDLVWAFFFILIYLKGFRKKAFQMLLNTVSI